MSDYGQPGEPPRRRYSAGQPSSPYDPPYDDSGPPADDPMAALEQRLQNMSPGPPAPQAHPMPESLPSVAAPPPPRDRPRTRPRPERARRRRGSLVARIAAPIVFLVAVIALVALVYESGIVGGTDESPKATPTPVATKSTRSGGQTTVVAFKKYTVKDGDTLSAIADKYGTTVDEILALNPKMSTSTLVVGTSIKVPKPSPSP